MPPQVQAKLDSFHRFLTIARCQSLHYVLIDAYGMHMRVKCEQVAKPAIYAFAKNVSVFLKLSVRIPDNGPTRLGGR